MRLSIFQSHPIQYYSPIWRVLARQPGVDLKVFYFSDHSIRGAVDEGFGREVKWDVPLIGGYESEFISKNETDQNLFDLDFPNAYQVIKDGQFDVVFTLGYRCLFERRAIKAAHQLKRRTMHRGDSSDLYEPGHRNWAKAIVRDIWLRRWFKGIDALCCVGTVSRQHYQRLGVPEERLFDSPHCIDTDLLEKQKATFHRPECRQALGLQHDDFAVVFSGKFIKRKDPLTLVNAAAQCRNKSKMVLIFVGDGELQSEIKARAAETGVRIIMPGFVNQSGLGAYFAAADVFALPSTFETWGLVVNEAMQFGLPVLVTSNMGCAYDLAKGKETGIITQPGDATELSRALDSLIENPARRASMADAARRVIAGFTPETAARGVASAALNRRD